MVAQLTYLHTELPNQLDYLSLALDIVWISTVCYLILATADPSSYAAEPCFQGRFEGGSGSSGGRYFGEPASPGFSCSHRGGHAGGKDLHC